MKLKFKIKGGILLKHIKNLCVYWCLPHLKQNFTTSTVATSDLIVVLSEKYLTTKDVYNAINYAPEAKEIVKYFIDNGYGDFLLRDMVHINPNRIYRKIENGEIINIHFKDLKKHLEKNKDENEYDYDY